MTIFLTYHVLVILMIVGLYGQEKALEIMAGIQGLYLLILIILRPYFVTSQNVMLIVSQFAGLVFTVLLIVAEHVDVSDQVMNYVVIGYQGLLILVSCLAFVRLYLHYKHNDRVWKVYHEEQDKSKGKDVFNKGEF